jgi:hypothetical protein
MKMNIKNILIGARCGTVTMFLLGFAIFGVALAGFMETHVNQAISRPADQMNFAALVLSNFMWALLVAVFIERTGSRTVMGGATTGAIAGFLGILGFDLTMYATTGLYLGRMVIAVDVLAFTVLTTAGGAVSGWIMGRMARPAAVSAG